MSNKSKRSQEGFISENVTNTEPDTQGEIKVHDNKHKVYINGVVRTTANLDEPQTFTNKEIDGWLNDIDNVTSVFDINQTSHGFLVGEGIYHNNQELTETGLDVPIGTNIYKAGHGFSDGDVIVFSGTLPPELSTGIYYYVINAVGDNFQVSTESEGTAVTIASGVFSFDARRPEWVKGKSNNANTLAYFVVVEVTDVDNFRALDFGRFYMPGHGYTVGEYYFLSVSNYGTPEPTFPGVGFSNPLFYVESTDVLQVKVYRPESVGDTTILDELGDVSVNSPANGEVLTYNSTSGLWEAAVPPGAGGGESNTASNVGGASEVFKQKTGVDLEFRTIQCSDPTLTITQNANDIDIKQTFPSTIPVDLIDLSSTTLPTGVPVIDGITVIDGHEVLFTNLTVGNNRIYEADLVTTPGNVIWTDAYGFEFPERSSVAVSDGESAGTDIYVHDEGGGWSFIVRGTIKSEDITGKTQVTPANGDFVLITDSNDANKLKKVQVDSFLSDTVYTHPNHTGDVSSVGDGAMTLEAQAINGQTLKATPVAGDHILISDSEAGNILKKATLTSLLGGGGGSLNYATGPVSALQNSGAGFVSSTAFVDITTSGGDLLFILIGDHTVVGNGSSDLLAGSDARFKYIDGGGGGVTSYINLNAGLLAQGETASPGGQPIRQVQYNMMGIVTSKPADTYRCYVEVDRYLGNGSGSIGGWLLVIEL